jgi:hypothetical protein
MPASHVRVEVPNGLRNLFCPACAAPVFTDAEGAAEELCDHVCFFIDWAGEITLASPENYTGDEERRQQELVDLVEETEDWDAFIARAVKTLPASALVLDVEDPGAGDDDGSRAVIAFDLATGADVAEEDDV